MHKTALVTGGAGFIGSHLCELLLQKGWGVRILDDMSTGSINNLSNIIDRDDVRLIVGSCEDESLLRPLVEECGTVFHLAAMVGVRKVMEDTVATIHRNIHSSEAVLAACNMFHRRVIITSTSEVYGANPNQSFSEEDNAIIGSSRHRRWCYAACKLLDEFLAYSYFHATGLPVTVVRLFNTIGPRQVGHYGMVVPNFVDRALNDEPIEVYGDGSQQRCFSSVHEVVSCLYELAVCKDAYGETFNIGSQNEISILELAQLIKEMTGSESEIITRSYEDVFGEGFVDMQRRVPNTDLLRDTIGKAPEGSLRDILREIIAEKQNGL